MQAQDVAAQVQQQYGDTSSVMPNYEQNLQQWTTDTNSQVSSVLQQYGLQASNFQSEQDALQSIQNASQSATGRLQALQAGNQIAGMGINQVQLLRQTVMAGNQAMLQIQANKANADQQDRNVKDKFINSQPHYGW
jgi:P-type conjugative transfer protein TrbJ